MLRLSEMQAWIQWWLDIVPTHKAMFIFFQLPEAIAFYQMWFLKCVSGAVATASLKTSDNCKSLSQTSWINMLRMELSNWSLPGGCFALTALSLQATSPMIAFSATLLAWMGIFTPKQFPTSNYETNASPHFISVSWHLFFVCLVVFLPCLCFLLILSNRGVYLIFEPTDFSLASLLIFYLLFLHTGQKRALKLELAKTSLKKSKSLCHTHPLDSITTTLPYLLYTTWLANPNISCIHIPHIFPHALWSWAKGHSSIRSQW